MGQLVSLRLCLGAFRTSPVERLYVDAHVYMVLYSLFTLSFDKHLLKIMIECSFSGLEL